MASIGEDIRAYLIADSAGVNATVSSRIHQNYVPIISSLPHIWLGRSGNDHITCMDGGTGLHNATFDLECIAQTADAAIDLAGLVVARLHAASSTTGSYNMQAMFVDDHDDAYEPKGVGDDSGNHVSALSVRVIYS